MTPLEVYKDNPIMRKLTLEQEEKITNIFHKNFSSVNVYEELGLTALEAIYLEGCYRKYDTII